MISKPDTELAVKSITDELENRKKVKLPEDKGLIKALEIIKEYEKLKDNEVNNDQGR